MKKNKSSFSPQQEKMFALLGNYVKKYKVLGIERLNLIYFLKIPNKNLNSAIYRLNAQFQKAFNTKKNLICYDKINDLYKIHDVWNFVNSFNY